ncbi:MAG: glutamate racemase [Atopobiaceae bacterium]|nr:glutamate racemase [Atopobiaceae bacterium]
MGDDRFVGVFDSGVGGISILKSLVAELPNETFRFFGDSAHAPYGDKPPEEVLRLSQSIVDTMVNDGAKAIVIACNTATSAAARSLRTTYSDIPIVGVEPALKPATLAFPQGRILVMATAVTLALEKFQRLAAQWGSGSQVIPVACVGLADRIEQGNLEADDMHELLLSLVGAYRGKVDAVVLGCTHYAFVKQQIRDILGHVTFFDSGAGTARQLRRVLTERGTLANADSQGSVSFASSKDTEEELTLYRWFYRQEL